MPQPLNRRSFGDEKRKMEEQIARSLFSITVCFVNSPRIRGSFERRPSREVQQYSCAKVLPLALGAGHHQ